MSSKTALVTGASYGVGRACALALAESGFAVAISATHADHLGETGKQLERLGRKPVRLALNLCSQDSIARAVDDVIEAFGHIDLLVNNAGANLRKQAVDVTRAEWDSVIEVNLAGTFFLTQRVGRHLIASGQPGAIVNIASAHGLVGVAERSIYGISKAALIHMTKMLAIEWAVHRIRVNAIAPGRLDTESPSRAATGADQSYMQAMLNRIPLHRLATVEEVAAAACFLASPHAAAITGQTFVLDGGLTVA